MPICKLLNDFFYSYLKLLISAIGLFFNILCIIGFTRSKNFKNQSSNMNVFKYLLIKSYCDAYLLAHNVVFCLLFMFIKPEFYLNYSLCVFRLIFEEYFDYIAELVSMFCEIGANFNRYRTITNKYEFLNKIPFVAKAFTMFFYAFGFYAYKFFQFTCIPLDNLYNDSSIGYNLTLKYEKKYTIEYKTLFFIHSIVRDGLSILIVLILNIITMQFMKKALSAKSNMAKKSGGQQNNANNSEKIANAEKNVTHLVIVSGFITIFGHILFLVYHLPVDIIHNDDCLNMISSILFYFSYSFNFFIYYMFNIHFKNYFKMLFNRCVQFITCNHVNYNVYSESGNSLVLSNNTVSSNK
jgi:hypothetical protein